MPVAVKLTLPPTGRPTVALRLPLPAAGQVPPPTPTQVQLTPVMLAGKVSATVALATGSGPALLATMV